MKEEEIRRPTKRQRRSTDCVFTWACSSTTVESSMGNTPSSKSVETKTEVTATVFTPSSSALQPSSPILSKSNKNKINRMEYNQKRQEVERDFKKLRVEEEARRKEKEEEEEEMHGGSDEETADEAIKYFLELVDLSLSCLQRSGTTSSQFRGLTLEDRCIASSVCKEWHNLAWGPLTTLEFTFRHRKEQEDIMIAILKKCISLRELVLSDCFLVTGRIMRHLPESLQSFKTINCPNYVKTVANVDLTALPPALLSLKLANCSNFDDEAFNFFPASLRELDLSGTKVSELGLLLLPQSLNTLNLSKVTSFKTISALPPTLQHLNLSNTPISSSNLQNLPLTLTHLDLTNCPNIGDDGILHLQSLSQLKELSLMKCESITDKGISYLPESLQVVNLRGCSQLTSGCLSNLPRRLLDVNLWGLNIKDNFSALPPLLNRLVLVRTPIEDTECGAFPYTLKTLCLFGCRITDIGVAALQSTTLKELDLSWTKITDKSLSLISEKFTTLRLLNVSNTPVTKTGILLLENNRPDRSEGTQRTITARLVTSQQMSGVIYSGTESDSTFEETLQLVSYCTLRSSLFG